MILTQLWNDPEIIGRIYLQAMHLFTDFIVGDQKDKFFEHTFSVQHKLTATRYHLNNFLRFHDQQYEEFKNAIEQNPNQTREAFELIFEIEAFLFQIKSSLDMLAKLLDVIAANRVKTGTYGEAGNKLIPGLEMLKNDKSFNASAIDDLVLTISSARDNWLMRFVVFRDTISHYKSLKQFKFLCEKDDGGKLVIYPPNFNGFAGGRYKELIPSNFLVETYKQNIEHHQDFMCRVLALRAPSGFVLMRENPEVTERKFNHPAAKYVKWCWGMAGKKTN